MTLQLAKLEKAADFLEGLKLPPGERFDMGRFYEPHPCGSAGCALGWMAFYEIFPELRLKSTFDTTEQTISTMNYTGEVIGLHVADIVFGLEGPGDAGMLFGGHYADEEHDDGTLVTEDEQRMACVRRIRAYVKLKGRRAA
jgi:hypothetical protein